jgi:hypothetical protein
MKIRRIVGATAMVAGLALVSPFAMGSAQAADPQDIVAAHASNDLDIAAAAQAYAGYSADNSVAYGNLINTGGGGSAPNVTCSQPVVTGKEILKHQDLVVTENHQVDEVAANAVCVSLTGQSFTATVSVRIDYCVRLSVTTCSWPSTGMTSSATQPATLGVSAPPLAYQAVYVDTHAALGKMRRVFACVKTTLTGSGCVTFNFSGTYGE